MKHNFQDGGEAFGGTATVEPDLEGNAEDVTSNRYSASDGTSVRPISIPAKFSGRTPEEICGGLWGFPKSCIDAALRFRATGAPEAIIGILPGMIEFHLPSGAAKPPAVLNDCERLREDLGLDSLSLTEMAFKIEDLLGVSIEIRDVAGIETVGDLKAFILGKLGPA